MNLRISLIALAVSASMAPAAMADIANYSGNTTGAATFNRLLEDLSALSGTGTSVAYSTFTFTVGASGDYTFLSTAAFDNFTFLYSGVFNAGQPLVGALEGNDDLLTATTSGFTHVLSAGSTYSYVTTGFANTDFGAFSNTIGGPGQITAVPEPGVWLLMALGLVGVALNTRRKQG